MIQYTKSFFSLLFILLINYSANSQIVALSGQDYSISVTSPTHQIINGTTINSCAYDTIEIIVDGDYFQNNTTYFQSNATTTFMCSTTMSSVINQNIIKIIPSGVIYETISISSYDIQGHTSNNNIIININVETEPPSFSGTYTPYDTVCQNSYVAITGNATSDIFADATSINSGDTTYLPDGSGVSYTSTLNVNVNGSDTMFNINDFSIFATLEHSYLGDLAIQIINPDGISVNLKSYPDGSNTFLGEPIDGNSQAVPGVGYEYHWKSNGSTTMTNAAGIYTYNYTNGLNQTVNGAKYLPPSYSYPVNATITTALQYVVYLPEEPYNVFIGTSINGDWTLKVTDNLAIDNGFIFDWGINISNIDSSLTYDGIISEGWINSTGVIYNTGDIISVYTETPGIHSFTYSATDTFGCVIDTVVNIYARPIPEVELGNDTSICANQSITLDAGSGHLVQFWSDGSILQTLNIDSTNTGLGDISVNVKVVDEYNCNNFDTITITFAECIGLNTNDDDIINVEIYPNPSQGIFTIDAELPSQENAIIQVFDIYGKEVLNDKLQNINGRINQNIDISTLSKGTYILSLQNKNGSFYHTKIIIN